MNDLTGDELKQLIDDLMPKTPPVSFNTLSVNPKTESGWTGQIQQVVDASKPSDPASFLQEIRVVTNAYLPDDMAMLEGVNHIGVMNLKTGKTYIAEKPPFPLMPRKAI